MKLSFRKLLPPNPLKGDEGSLFILHGLFGSSDNWQTLGKQFAKSFTVYLIDQRNHGRSPRDDEFNYAVMSEDLKELAEAENLDKVLLLGHSMGGKVAMQFAVSYPERVEKMVVVDIGPKKYPVTNLDIIDAIEKVDLNLINSRKEAETILSQNIKEVGVLQFLLKNLYWNDPEVSQTLRQKLAWRFNLKAIKNNIRYVSEPTPIPDKPLEMPVLFVNGEKSDYVFPSDIKLVNTIFSNAKFITIQGAGHWVHADKPTEFYTIVNWFLGKNNEH